MADDTPKAAPPPSPASKAPPSPKVEASKVEEKVEEKVAPQDSTLSEVKGEDQTPKPTSDTAGVEALQDSPQKVMFVVDRDTKVECEVLPEEGREWNGVDGSIHLRAYIDGMNRDFYNVRFDAGGKEPGTYHIVEEKKKVAATAATAAAPSSVEG